MNKLMTPDLAEAHILSVLQTLRTEETPLSSSLGRILRTPLMADRPFPPFDRVTMDGIAFRASEAIGPLRLHGLHPAGAPAPPALPHGSCWQIMTGALLPPDCDTVVPYEEVKISETHASIHSDFTPKPGQFIHRKGSDAPTGTLLVPAPTRLTPAHLGLAASIGACSLTVTRSPRIHLFTTGDELVPIEKTPLPHQLRRSNGLTLQMALQTRGAHEVQLTHLPDRLEETIKALKTALGENDFIVLSGGISKGKKDYVRPALESLIGSPTFHGVAQRPGKPLAFWAPSDQHPAVFALPGNPNSTLTTFHRYLVPALDQLSGLEPLSPISFPLASPAPTHDRLTQLLPAILNDRGELNLLLPQNSGDFLTPLAATHLVEIPPGPPVKAARTFLLS